MSRMNLKIDGMSCGHCVISVRKALEGVQGVAVQNVEVGAATVEYDPGETTPENIIQAIREAGYTAVAAG